LDVRAPPARRHGSAPIRYSGLRQGAYILGDCQGQPDIILIGTGSEVQLALGAYEQLVKEGIKARVVSMPSWELFENQDAAYRESVLPKKIQPRMAVEAGASLGWERYVGSSGKIIAIDRFGASAPYKIIFEKLGFTVENILAQAKPLLPKKESSNKVKTKKTIRKKK